MFKESEISERTLSQMRGCDDNSLPCIAIVGDNDEQIGPWFKCKDYIQDVVRANHVKQSFSIYGFKYNVKNDPPLKNKFRLAYRWREIKDDVFAERRANMVETIKDIEKQIKIEKHSEFSEPFKIGGHNAVLIDANIEWSKAIPLISFLSLVGRLSMLNEGRTLKSLLKMKKADGMMEDIYYLTSSRGFVNHLVKNGISDFPNENWAAKTTHTCHNYGIVGWSKENS